MKGIVILKSELQWHNGFISSPFLLSVKNVNIVLNQILFLKTMGCLEIRIVKDTLSYQSLEKEIGNGKKWGVEISYEPLQNIARQDISSFYSSFINNERCIVIKGLFFFNSVSKLKSRFNHIQIIDGENETFKTELIDSFKSYFEMNMGSSDFSIHRFDYTKDLEGPFMGNNVELEKFSYVSKDCFIGHKTLIEKGGVVQNNSIIGSSCKLGRNSFVSKSIILDEVLVSSGIKLTNSIVGSNFIYSYDQDKAFQIEDKNLFKRKNVIKVSKIDRFISLGLLTFLYLPIQLILLIPQLSNYIKIKQSLNLYRNLQRIYAGEMEFVGVSKEDLKLLEFEYADIPTALFSVCNPYEEDILKTIHLRYYLGTRYEINRFKLLTTLILR